MSDRERERRREIFHLLIDFPNSPYSQSWARQKPESRIKISLWSFQMGDRRSDTWPSSTAFLGALAGNGTKNRALKWCSHMGTIAP